MYNNDLSILPISLEKRKATQRTSLSAKFADPILDKLYRIEEHKWMICFTICTMIVAFYGWQVLRAVIG